jgi:preprotein translocase subunit Sec63
MFILNTIFHVLVLFLILFKKIKIIGANNSNNNPYQILNLTTSYVTASELKRKYRLLAKKYHPDKYKTKNNEHIEDVNARFLEITNAYETLKHPRNEDTVETLRLDLSFLLQWEKYKIHTSSKEKMYMSSV